MTSMAMTSATKKPFYVNADQIHVRIGARRQEYLLWLPEGFQYFPPIRRPTILRS